METINSHYGVEAHLVGTPSVPVTWKLLAWKWNIGKAIASQRGFRRGRPSMVRYAASELGVGFRDAYNCVRFFEMFPGLELDRSFSRIRDLQLPLCDLSWTSVRRHYLDLRKPQRTIRRSDARRASATRVGKCWRSQDHARMMGLIGCQE